METPTFKIGDKVCVVFSHQRGRTWNIRAEEGTLENIDGGQAVVKIKGRRRSVPLRDVRAEGYDPFSRVIRALAKVLPEPTATQEAAQ